MIVTEEEEEAKTKWCPMSRVVLTDALHVNVHKGNNKALGYCGLAGKP